MMVSSTLLCLLLYLHGNIILRRFCNETIHHIMISCDLSFRLITFMEEEGLDKPEVLEVKHAKHEVVHDKDDVL